MTPRTIAGVESDRVAASTSETLTINGRPLTDGSGNPIYLSEPFGSAPRICSDEDVAPAHVYDPSSSASRPASSITGTPCFAAASSLVLPVSAPATR